MSLENILPSSFHTFKGVMDRERVFSVTLICAKANVLRDRKLVCNHKKRNEKLWKPRISQLTHPPSSTTISARTHVFRMGRSGNPEIPRSRMESAPRRGQWFDEEGGWRIQGGGGAR